MFTFPIFRRQSDRPTTPRTQVSRRPMVEGLEGRQLLSGLTVTTVPAIVGAHIGMNVAAIQGAHIGTNVV